MKQPADFAYILRFAMDVEAGAEPFLPALKRFISDAQIDDVTVFTEGEEVSQGHMTAERQRRFVAMLEAAKPAIAEAGATFSINHWTTLYHADRGRALLPDQNFTRMVDAYGRESTISACPLCPSFRAYYADLVRRFGALTPDTFWIEDDFRYHNHAPLQWGGCFCEKHMDEYRRRAGATFTREEFVRAITAPGKPHPWRTVWLDTCRDGLIGFARKLRHAMDEVSPGTHLGLMSSDPSVHCAEGRDWDALIGAFSNGADVPHRIHLPAYLERTPQEYLWLFNTVSMPCRAVGPANVAVYPELENFPFSAFTKSLALTRFQIKLALALNIRGITMDLFEIGGSGIPPEDAHAASLAGLKPFLTAANRSGAFAGERLGARVLVSPRASYALETAGGVADPSALIPRETFWGGVFSTLGIPFAFVRRDDAAAIAALSGQIVAASGQVFRGFTAEEVRGLFARNYVILDGEAALTLHALGLGELAGIAGAKRVAAETGAVCYEESATPEEGFLLPRANAQTFLGDAVLIDYAPGTRIVSRLMRFDRTLAGAGMAVHNERALVLPFICEDGYPGGMFLRLRAWLLRKEIARAAGNAAPMLATRHQNLAMYAFAAHGKRYLYLANASADPVPEVQLLLTGDSAKCFQKNIAAQALTDTDARWKGVPVHISDGQTVTLALPLAPLECALVEMQ